MLLPLKQSLKVIRNNRSVSANMLQVLKLLFLFFYFCCFFFYSVLSPAPHGSDCKKVGFGCKRSGEHDYRAVTPARSNRREQPERISRKKSLTNAADREKKKKELKGRREQKRQREEKLWSPREQAAVRRCGLSLLNSQPYGRHLSWFWR